MVNEKEYREFRVYDEAQPIRKGWCKSYYTHFDIQWDDGKEQLGVMDLADIGVAKMFEDEVDLTPQKFA